MAFLEMILEGIIAPALELIEYFGKGKKHQKLIQAIVVALVFIAMLSIIVGGVFIYCGSSFFVPGIIMTVISAAVLIAYLIFAVVFSFKNR